MNKIRLFNLLEIFIKYSDENNYVSLKDIIEKLENKGFFIERKTIYDDIKSLKKLGYDIEVVKGSIMKYHLLNHTYDIIEAKLMFDAINSLNFLDQKKIKEISEKFLNQLSVFQKNKILKSSIINQNNISNKNILYNINELQNAIDKNNFVSFKYFDININKQKQYRKQSKKYTLLPYAIILVSQNYYCICYDEKYKNFSNYRIDKMDNIIVEDITSLKIPFDLNDYTGKSFNMFSGNSESVSVEFKNDVSNLVIDKFSWNFIIVEKKENSFIANFNITVSPTFYSWIAQFGTNAKIISPVSVKDDFKSYVKSLLLIYE